MAWSCAPRWVVSAAWGAARCGVRVVNLQDGDTVAAWSCPTHEDLNREVHGGVHDDHGLLAISDPDEMDGGEMDQVHGEESDAMETPFDESDELDIESELDPAIDAELEGEGIAED